jgi:hypothetical protein
MGAVQPTAAGDYGEAAPGWRLTSPICLELPIQALPTLNVNCSVRPSSASSSRLTRLPPLVTRRRGQRLSQGNAMPTHTISIVIDGATGRLGTTQHLRALLAVRNEGGLGLANGDRLMPEPLLLGRRAASPATAKFTGEADSLAEGAVTSEPVSWTPIPCYLGKYREFWSRGSPVCRCEPQLPRSIKRLRSNSLSK